MVWFAHASADGGRDSPYLVGKMSSSVTSFWTELMTKSTYCGAVHFVFFPFSSYQKYVLRDRCLIEKMSESSWFCLETHRLLLDQSKTEVQHHHHSSYSSQWTMFVPPPIVCLTHFLLSGCSLTKRSDSESSHKHEQNIFMMCQLLNKHSVIINVSFKLTEFVMVLLVLMGLVLVLMETVMDPVGFCW